MTTSALKRKLTDACTCSTSQPKTARVASQNQPPSRSYSHKFHCCCLRPMQPPLAESCRSYLTTGTPTRVMFYSQNQWTTFPETALRVLINAFKEDKSSTVVFSDGQTLLVDFLSMTAINLKTGKQRSISWIDEAAKCFFPPLFIDQEHSDDSVKEPSGKADRVVEPTTRESQLSGPSLADMLRKKIKQVEKDSQTFQSIQYLFYSGLGPFAAPDIVLQIYHYQPDDSDDLAQFRLEEFKRQVATESATKEGIRDFDVNRGWFGSGKREIAMALIYGFSKAWKPNEGTYGTDLYLMPEDRAFASVNLCDVDEKGVQYMLLCRVITNLPKEASGLNPKYYFVSSVDSDSRIHPEFLISFKLSPVVREYLMGLNCMQLCEPVVTCLPACRVIINHEGGPTSPWMSFPSLFAAIENDISPIAKELLFYHYDEMKKKRISREELVKKIRIIVGDHLLRSTLTNLQHNPSAWYRNPVVNANQESVVAAAEELISAPPVSLVYEPVDTSLSVAIGTNVESSPVGTSHTPPRHSCPDSSLPPVSYHGTDGDSAPSSALKAESGGTSQGNNSKSVKLCYLSIEQGMQLNNAAIDSILRAAKLEPGL